MRLSERLQKAREHAGLSQGDLAKISGVVQQTISNLETGKTKETAAIVALAVACGVRAEWLAQEAGPMIQDPRVAQLVRKIEALPEGFRTTLETVLDGLIASSQWDRRTERRRAQR